MEKTTPCDDESGIPAPIGHFKQILDQVFPFVLVQADHSGPLSVFSLVSQS